MVFPDFIQLVLFSEAPYLAVKTTYPCVALLGIDVIGFVFNVMVTFYELPVSILSLEDFTYACLEYQCRMQACSL